MRPTRLFARALALVLSLATPLALLLMVSSMASACSSDDTSLASSDAGPSEAGPVAPPGQGTLRVQITGLPDGVNANVIINGPTANRTLTASADVPLPAGAYDVVASAVGDKGKSDGSGFKPDLGIQSVTVTADAGVTVRIDYGAVQPKIAPEAKVVSADAAALLQPVVRDKTGGATLTFANATAETSGWKVGDILALGITPATPRGFLGRIVSTDGKTVTTKYATIDEVVKEGVIDIERSYTAADITQVKLLDAGANIRICQNLGASLGVVKGSNGAAGQISGDLCLTPTVRFSSSYNLFSLPDMTAFVNAGITGSVNLAGTATAGLTVEFPLAEVPLAAIPFFIGPIPFVLTPQVNVYVGAAGTITAGLSIGVEYAANDSAGFHYDGKANKFTPLLQRQESFSPIWPDGITLTAQARAFGGAQFVLFIDELGGPFVGLEPYGAIDIPIASPPTFTLHAGVDLALGIEANPIIRLQYGLVLEYDRTILTSADVAPPGTKTFTNALVPSNANLALGPNDLFYVPTGNDIRAMRASGTLPQWTYTGTGSMMTVLRAADDSIYATDINGMVYALDTFGAERWKKQFLPGVRLATPKAAELYMADGSFVRSIDPANGNELWATNLGGQVLSLSIAKDGAMYAPNAANDLQAVNNLGTKMWANPPATGAASAPEVAVAADKTVYMVTGNQLAAITSYGELKWKVGVFGDATSSPTVGPDGTIYLCATNPGASVFAIEPKAGAMKWILPLGENCKGPPAVGADGNVYLLTASFFTAVSGATGKLVWSKPAPPGPGADTPIGSPLLLPNGSAVGVNSGGLYVFRTGTAIAATGWPRSGFDNLSTGAAK